ncbi:MAG TPA: glyoxalase, partial [Ruminococcaceae bacterium]|nr:glyoxalase [Oscillospiraceae bacterium]
CLQLNFDKLAAFPAERMRFKTYNMELYFETEDMDAFTSLLALHPEVECLGEVKTYPWRQRVIRVFDPDGHIIEVGESMEFVACREFEKGLSVQETARIIEHPLELVQAWYEKYQSTKQ